MRLLGLSGVRRDKKLRTTIPGEHGKRAGDLQERDFTAQGPDRVWVTDFTYVRSWAGWVYVAFILDVYAQRIVAWHAATCKDVELVMTPLRMAVWKRARERASDPGLVADPSLERRQPGHLESSSPSTSTWRASGPRWGQSAKITTTP